jgi:hypothetical protein
VKRALDTEWSDPGAKDEALNTLVQQLNSLNAWLRKKLPEELEKPPLKEHLDTLAQIRTPNAVPISASDLVHVQQKRYHCGPPDSMAPAMANQRGSRNRHSRCWPKIRGIVLDRLFSQVAMLKRSEQ